MEGLAIARPFFMDLISYGYIGLFIATFLSATILPFSSEIILFALLSKGLPVSICVLIATIGNSAGGITNYFIGKIGNPKALKRFGFTEEKIEKYELAIQKYGYWLAFFSWLPIIGDPLIIGLGFFRVKLVPTTLLMIAGKFLRYLLIGYYFLN